MNVVARLFFLPLYFLLFTIVFRLLSRVFQIRDKPRGPERRKVIAEAVDVSIPLGMLAVTSHYAALSIFDGTMTALPLGCSSYFAFAIGFHMLVLVVMALAKSLLNDSRVIECVIGNCVGLGSLMLAMVSLGRILGGAINCLSAGP